MRGRRDKCLWVGFVDVLGWLVVVSISDIRESKSNLPESTSASKDEWLEKENWVAVVVMRSESFRLLDFLDTCRTVSGKQPSAMRNLGVGVMTAFDGADWDLT